MIFLRGKNEVFTPDHRSPNHSGPIYRSEGLPLRGYFSWGQEVGGGWAMSRNSSAVAAVAVAAPGRTPLLTPDYQAYTQLPGLHPTTNRLAFESWHDLASSSPPKKISGMMEIHHPK